MPEERPRQSLLANLLLGASVTAATLGGAEIWARRSEPPAPPSPHERRTLEWHDEFYTIKGAPADWPPRKWNGDGMHDRAHAREKPAGTRRVVCLGDSVTVGPDDHPEDAYPQQLQRQLDARGPGVEVMNVALWGWATTQERAAYERIARPYRPDQVVLGICLNDIQDLQNSLSRPPEWLAALHRRSALVRRVVDARGREIRSVADIFTSDDSPHVRAGFDRLFAEIRTLRQSVETDGARLSVLLLPYRGQVRPDAPRPVAQERVRDFCAREGLPFLDPLPQLARVGEPAFLPDDGIHLSAAGGAAVAEAIVQSRLVAAPQPRVAPDASEEALLPHLHSPSDPDFRRDAAWALGRRDTVTDKAVAALRSALGDPEEAVRAEAATALARLAPRALSARDDLFRALEDQKASVRWRAAEALARIGASDPDAVPELTAALRSADPHVAQFAAWALGEAGEAARAAVPSLIDALRAPDLGLRQVAAKALGRVGDNDPSVVAALAAAFDDDTWPDRWQAARSLGRLGQDAVPALLQALRSSDEHVRAEAALALGQIGPAGAAARAALTEASRDPNPNVRSAASKALRRIARP